MIKVARILIVLHPALGHHRTRRRWLGDTLRQSSPRCLFIIRCPQSPCLNGTNQPNRNRFGINCTAHLSLLLSLLEPIWLALFVLSPVANSICNLRHLKASGMKDPKGGHNIIEKFQHLNGHRQQLLTDGMQIGILMK